MPKRALRLFVVDDLGQNVLVAARNAGVGAFGDACGAFVRTR